MSTAANLGVRDRDLVAYVGAGGKSTLLLDVGMELASKGSQVVLTTTTKMGANQMPEWTVPCYTIAEVARAFDRGKGAFLVKDLDTHKIVGPSPALVDKVYVSASADHVLVEADGAAGRLLKAPAAHEPVIPETATLVVIVGSINAVGARIGDATHRPEGVCSLLGTDIDHVLEPHDVAHVLSHPAGGLARVPDEARVTVVLTGIREDSRAVFGQITQQLSHSDRIERVAGYPDHTPVDS